MDAHDENPTFGRAFRVGYGLGLVLCVAWPLVLQVLLGTAIRPGPADADPVVQELGYTFTGLTLGAAAFVAWRWGRIREGFREVREDRRPGLMVRELILYAALFGLSALYGVATYALGGPGAERYSRTFIALSTIMFFAFVPRSKAWRDAARKEPS